MSSPVGAPPLSVQPSANVYSSSTIAASTIPTSSVSPVTSVPAAATPAADDPSFQQQRDKCNKMKGYALNSPTTCTHTAQQAAPGMRPHATVHYASDHTHWFTSLSVVCSGRRVRFMFDSMKSAGCPVDGDAFIQCDTCEPLISGAMYQKPGSGDIGVLMCQNRLQGKSQDYFDTVVAHELVHAFDYCRAHTDFASLPHHACTEVRAANLSGECTWMREAKRGILRFRGHHEECVRRRAVISVLGNPGVRTSEEAKEAVGRVFDRCYRDVQPHGSQPW